MTERNITRYHLEQSDNKSYILTTSLINDKLKLTCQDSNNQTFLGAFTLLDLLNLSKYFKTTRSVAQVQQYLNGIIEKQRVGISQSGNILYIILYLINKDTIKIPLKPSMSNYNNYNIKQAAPTPKNQYIQNQVSSAGVQYFGANNIQNNNIQGLGNISNLGNIQQGQYIYQNNSNQQQYLNLTQNQNQQNFLYQIPKVETNLGVQGVEQVNSPITGIPILNSQIGVSQVINQGNLSSFPATDITNQNIYSYQYDESKIGQLEDNTNIIRAEQEKLKNDLKRLLEEAKKLKEENEVYKTDHESLTNENDNLKKENEKYKQQILNYENENKVLQEENNSLKNQFTLLNKDIDAFESQNNEIRKMYEELENENINYKNQLEQTNKENELLRQQVEDLNNNYTIINNEIESIKNENEILKNNLETQKGDDNNEEMINKLIEENNMYKMKAEENELLKKQIEELQYQIQMGQERQEEEGQEKEVKGDIIHDIKELEMLTKKINKDNKKIIINLLYKASVDGDKAAAFHEKCDEAKNTIVLVETKNGKRFGGYTTCSWSGNCVDKNDPEAFIFSFDKMKTYDNIPGDEAIGCYPKFGPIFLGCQIKIFDNAFVKGGTTFEKELNFNTEEDYELTGGDRTFEIKDIEVYEVIIE